jgi:hypothetical protein
VRERVWWGATLAAVLVAAAAGPLPAGTLTSAHPPAKSHIVDVGPDPCDLNEAGVASNTQTISRSGGHKITWKSKPAGRVLGIILHVPANDPVPFSNMTQIGKDPQGNILWALPCNNGQCKSGPATANARYHSYIYDQVLDTEKCDGMIIIDR